MFENDPEDTGAEQPLPLPGSDKPPFVTWALLSINIVVWLMVHRAGVDQNPEIYLDYGAMFGPFIAKGEVWRLFTAMFLHIGVAHIALNGLALLFIGRLVEQAFGHVRFLTIYLLAGLAGSVASFTLNSIAIGAGASGAIFGVLGALAAYFFAQRAVFGSFGQRNLTGVLFLAAINMAYSFDADGVDGWAHLGGFVAGFLLGVVLAPQYRVQRSSFRTPEGVADTNSLLKRAWVVPATLAAVVLGTWLGAATLPDNAYSHVYLAEAYYEQRNLDMALEEIDRALHTETAMARGHVMRAMAEAHLLRGQIFAEVGDTSRATIDLATAAHWGSPAIKAKAKDLLKQLRSGV